MNPSPQRMYCSRIAVNSTCEAIRWKLIPRNLEMSFTFLWWWVDLDFSWSLISIVFYHFLWAVPRRGQYDCCIQKIFEVVSWCPPDFLRFSLCVFVDFLSFTLLSSAVCVIELGNFIIKIIQTVGCLSKLWQSTWPAVSRMSRRHGSESITVRCWYASSIVGSW